MYSLLTGLLTAIVVVPSAALVNVKSQTLAQFFSSNTTAQYGIYSSATFIASNPTTYALIDDNSTYFTVFAPTDNAINLFNQKYPELSNKFSTDPDFQDALLEYHILPNTTFVPAYPGRFFYPTAYEGQPLRIDVGFQPFSPVKAISAGSGAGYKSRVITYILLSNAIVYTVDTVMIQPLDLSSTLNYTNLTDFNGLLNQTGLAETFSELTNITLFAPRNSAVQDILAKFNKTNVVPSLGLATSIIDFHVIEPTLTSTDIITYIVETNILHNYGSVSLRTGFNSSSPNDLLTASVNPTSARMYIGGPGNREPAAVVMTDIIFDYGIIHVVDKVLLPSQETISQQQQVNEIVYPSF